ncbi:hypothetical protein Roomu2_00111 [Pseudomonas phage vB_PpuM-Roomu-2]|uniref:Uncharacterized protein n=2 Tax=Tartuvirus TaxID=3424912 RepID=A0AAX4N0H4_9CAUD
MFDHELIETLESMQGQPIFLAVWQSLYDEIQACYCRGELGVSQWNYAHRLLAKVR